MSNVIPFPKEVLADQKVRQCERMVEMLLDLIENSDPDSDSVKERVQAATAPAMLECWQDDLHRALAAREMLNADDALRHGGSVYRAALGTAGAH